MRVQKTSYMWKNCIWNPAISSCENGKYLANIIDDLVITCNEVIDTEEEEAIPTNFNEKKQPVKHKISTFYLPFY